MNKLMYSWDAMCVICSTAGILILPETAVNELNVKYLLEVYIEICSSSRHVLNTIWAQEIYEVYQEIHGKTLKSDVMWLEKYSWILKRQQLDDGNE